MQQQVASADAGAPWQELKVHLDSLLGPENAGRFTEDDLRLLWEGGYATLEDLKVASHTGLRNANVKPARADQIIHAQGGGAGKVAAATGAVAGRGSGSTAACGDAAVLATIKARMPCSAKYAAHLLVPTSLLRKEAATVVGQHHVATYVHEGHSTWKIGQKMQVAVYCPQEDRRLFADAEVVYKNPIQDVAILEVQRDLSPPVLDSAISPGDMYYVHGQSTQAQVDADVTSINHGMVTATEFDAQCHIRGDIIAGASDSGGGCFSVATGKLIAMVVGSQAQTNKAALVPITIIASILLEISASKAPGAAA